MALDVPLLLVLAFTAALPVEWEAPAGCPNGEQLRRQVRELSHVDDARLSVRGSVRERSGQWQLMLVISGPSGEGTRELRGDDCQSVTDAAAVVIALALEQAPTPAPAGSGRPAAVPARPRTGSAPSPRESVTRPVAGVGAASDPAGPRAAPGASPSAAAASPPASTASPGNTSPNDSAAPLPPSVASPGNTAPNDSAAPPPPEPPSDPVAPAPPSTPATLSAATQPSPAAARELRIGVAASADVGTLPAPAPGAQVNATLGLGRLSLTLALGAWAPASLAVPGGGRITIASALAGLRAGVRILGAGTWALGVQAGLDAGAVWGQGVGLEAARSSAGAYVDALAGASGRFAFTPRWALLLELEAGPTLLAPTFGVVGLGPVFSPAAAVGRARLGVEVSL